MRLLVATCVMALTAACGAGASQVGSSDAPRSGAQNPSGPRILIATGAYIDGPMHLAYFTTEDSHLIAVDILSGETRWTSNDAVLAIRADEGAVLALRLGNPFQAITLDPTTGAKLEECTPVALPPWANVSARDGMGSRFRLEVRERGLQTFVEWGAATHYVGGVAPTPEQEAAASNEATGIVSITFDRTHCIAREAAAVPIEGRAEAVTTPLMVEDVEITFAMVNDGSMVISALDTATSTSRWHRTLPSPDYQGPYPP